MKAIVTGGGGFLGSRIAIMLRDRGDDVTLLGRNRYPHIEAAGIRAVQADIRDAAALENAFRGMDVVFHTASKTGIWGARREFWAINVDGTRAVIESCRRMNVRRLVHTSTPSVVFGRRELCGVDESQPPPSRYLAHYPRTKAIAEQLVLEANGPQLATVALRPHLIWGPGDPHLFPRIVQRARAGKLRIVGSGNNLADITFIDNAADAHVRAASALAESDRCRGRAYFISQGEPVRLWPWLRSVLNRAGIEIPDSKIPFRLAYFAGTTFEVLHHALRLRAEPQMTRFIACQLAKSHYFNIEAAMRDIGYRPMVSTSEGEERLVHWLREPVLAGQRDSPSRSESTRQTTFSN